MKHLILVRHAKSSWDDSALPDKKRPLGDRGKRDAPKMGKRLAKRDVKPDLTGKLPPIIDMGGGWIGLRLLIESRGTDIDLTPDEELVYDAIIRERRFPGGSAIPVQPEFTPDDSASLSRR